LLLDPSRYRLKSSSFGISCPFRVFGLPKYRPYCFCDPALPLAPLPRLCGFPLTDCRRLPFKLTTASSLRAAPSYRVLPSDTYPTASTAESSHGLLFPSAHQEFEVHFREPSQLATFRLQGLVALLAFYSLKSRAGFISHQLRSWDSPFGGILSREVPETFQSGRTHLPLASRLFRRRNVRPARQASVSGFAPLGIALRPHGVLGRGSPAPPLGFRPCRVCYRRPWSDFSDAPLTCLVGPVDFSTDRPAPQSLNRSRLRLARPIPEYQPAEATLLGFLHLPAPDHSS